MASGVAGDSRTSRDSRQAETELLGKRNRHRFRPQAFGVEQMADAFRTVDARNSTDADGNSYYVVFCARDSDNPTTKPGHAYVVWGVEDSSAAMSSQKAFGFYPDPSNESSAIFGTVPGQLADEWEKQPSLSLLTARLIVQVNKDPYNASQAVIDNWTTSDYNLYTQNCMNFARAVAVSLGLFPPPIAAAQFPTSYLEDLIQNTSQGQ
jgi:hypothetical protein